MKQPLHFTFSTFDGMRGAIANMIEQVQAVAGKTAAQFTKETRHALNHIFTEAWINHVKHGNQSNPALSVIVEGSVETDPNGALQLMLRSRDEGSGFDVSQIPKSSRSDPTGRGVRDMRSYLGRMGGRIVYNAKGNEMTIVLDVKDPAPAFGSFDAPVTQEGKGQSEQAA